MPSNLQLYINDQLADLSSDSSIELTIQINNLAEVANQQGNTTKQFKLPLTQVNRRLLGYPDDMRFTTNTPYEVLICRIVQDGIEIVPFGIGEINGVDDSSVDFVVLSGNVDFFDALGGNIYEMGDSTTDYGIPKLWAPYDHAWIIENVAHSQNKASGWIWPVVDYGTMSATDFTEAINVRNMRPGFFIHTAIELLAKQTGYTINPESFLLKQPLYKKLIVQFANDSFEHGSDYQNQPDNSGLIAASGGDQAITHIPITDNVGFLNFDNRISDPLNQFDGRYFRSKKIMAVDVALNIPRLWFRGMKNDTHPSTVDINVIQDTTNGSINLGTISFDLTEWIRIDGTAGGNLAGYWNFLNKKLTCEAELAAGDNIHLSYEFKGDRPAFFTLYSGASLTITPKTVEVLYTQNVQCERILPDVSQKDFLKDTLQRFGIICQTDNVRKEITFSSIKDIIKNVPRAYDWTSKCIDQGSKTTFQLGNYAQTNWLRYQYDESIPLYKMPKYFADDHIDINDKSLSPDKPQIDLFTSIFSPSTNRPWLGGTIAEINKVDVDAEDQEFTVSTKPRLLINQVIDLRNIGNKSITFTDGQKQIVVNDFISVPYFYKPDGDNLAWKDLPDTAGAPMPGLKRLFYPELEKILQQTKKKARYFLLIPRDIAELDLLIPVYLEQDSAYFYINKIEAWKKGQLVKVELVRL